ncbi:MAG: glycosyl transferase group 1 [Nitrospira sp.]|jgi:glycosyltransferase involved in cell wall biosynthesis|nr:glycosyl transferase group 1 [Nitrospira sp.]
MSSARGHRPVTVWHTSASTGFGGLEIRMLEEAAGFNARGYQLTFVCNPGSPLARRAGDQNMAMIPLPMRQSYEIRSMARFWSLLGRHHVDILHTHSSKDHWICGPAARLRGVPIVRTRHIGTAVKTNPISSLIYTTFSDRLLTSSAGGKQDLLRIPGLNAEHVVNIPAGINLDRFVPTVSGAGIAKEFGLEQADPIIGYISRLERGKGFRYLMEAAPSILERWPRAKFLFVGDGPPWDKQTADELLDRHRLRPHAILAGFRTEIPEFLAAMTCLVFPSFKIEGTPQVLLQAMAMGIPVVATDVGGIPDLVVDGETGRLIEPQNSEALSRAVQWILSHRQEARAHADRARQRVLRDFSLDRAIERTESVYRELL